MDCNSTDIAPRRLHDSTPLLHDRPAAQIHIHRWIGGQEATPGPTVHLAQAIQRGTIHRYHRGQTRSESRHCRTGRRIPGHDIHTLSLHRQGTPVRHVPGFNRTARFRIRKDRRRVQLRGRAAEGDAAAGGRGPIPRSAGGQPAGAQSVQHPRRRDRPLRSKRHRGGMLGVVQAEQRGDRSGRGMGGAG